MAPRAVPAPKREPAKARVPAEEKQRAGKLERTEGFRQRPCRNRKRFRSRDGKAQGTAHNSGTGPGPSTGPGSGQGETVRSPALLCRETANLAWWLWDPSLTNSILKPPTSGRAACLFRLFARGLEKSWILQYSLPRAPFGQFSRRRTLDAPWPYYIVRPNLKPRRRRLRFSNGARLCK